MTEQQPLQSVRRSTARVLGSEEELGRLWAEFSQARASLAEVMSDDELRDFGINVDVLDERP